MPNGDVSGEVKVQIIHSEEGVLPRAPGAAGPPTVTRPTMLMDIQKQQLAAVKESQKMQQEANEYQKLVAGEKEGEPKKGFSALTKWLPIMAGLGGLAGLLRQSKVMSGYMSAFSQVTGAAIDTALMPFTPLLTGLLEEYVKVIPALNKITTSVEKIGWAETGRLIAQGFWAEVTEPKPEIRREGIPTEREQWREEIKKGWQEKSLWEKAWTVSTGAGLIKQMWDMGIFEVGGVPVKHAIGGVTERSIRLQHELNITVNPSTKGISVEEARLRTKQEGQAAVENEWKAGGR